MTRVTSRSRHSSRNGGRRGFRRRISLTGSNSRPSEASIKRERRRARPCLRRACHRIKRRAATALPLKAAEQFRQSTQIHIGRGVEKPREQRSIPGLAIRSAQDRARSTHCRAARSSRCGTTSDCKRTSSFATVRMPQPEKKRGCNKSVGDAPGAVGGRDASEQAPGRRSMCVRGRGSLAPSSASA